jgi:hypothetical protein
MHHRKQPSGLGQQQERKRRWRKFLVPLARRGRKQIRLACGFFGGVMSGPSEPSDSMQPGIGWPPKAWGPPICANTATSGAPTGSPSARETSELAPATWGRGLSVSVRPSLTPACTPPAVRKCPSLFCPVVFGGFWWWHILCIGCCIGFSTGPCMGQTTLARWPAPDWTLNNNLSASRRRPRARARVAMFGAAAAPELQLPS